MKIDLEHTHSVADKLMTFANAMKHGWIKHWKAHSMCVTVAELIAAGADMRGERLSKYVRNCLEMEGFRDSDCDVIAEWIEQHLIDRVTA